MTLLNPFIAFLVMFLLACFFGYFEPKMADSKMRVQFYWLFILTTIATFVMGAVLFFSAVQGMVPLGG